MRSLSLGLVWLIFGAAGCSADGGRLLVVELATDLTSGVSFVGIHIEVRRGDTLIGQESQLAPRGQSFSTPQRVAMFDDLADGTYEVHAALVDLDGAPVAARTTIVDIHEDLALTVVIAASCIGVACPGSGDDASATACAGGRCVDPRCSPDTPELCGDVCFSDATCPVVVGLAGACIGGICLYPRCDDGNECTDDAAIDGECVSTPNDRACNDAVFCNGLDQCQAGACTLHGTPPCSADRCDETTGTCDIHCANDGDCPAEVVGDWSACAGFVDMCDDTAEQTRTHVSFHCAGGMCASDTATEMQSCTRMTDGVDCGGQTCDWVGCRYPVCSADGSEPGSCYDHRCMGGACAEVFVRDDTRPCPARASQEGLICRLDGSFCQGTCRSSVCTELCLHCGGVCTAVGCRTGSC